MLFLDQKMTPTASQAQAGRQKMSLPLDQVFHTFIFQCHQNQKMKRTTKKCSAVNVAEHLKPQSKYQTLSLVIINNGQYMMIYFNLFLAAANVFMVFV